MNTKWTMRSHLRRTASVLVLALSTAGLIGCSSDGDDDGSNGIPMEPTYEDFIARGWAAFAAGDYADAERHFQDAVDLDAARAEGHSGLGWSSLGMDDPESADPAFESGATGIGETSVLADLFAGWAFTSNALKDPTGVDDTNYSESNAHATEALDLDADWSFTHGPALDRRDLVVLRAENHFALGAFTASLAEVRLLDAGFTADVETPAGQAALAARIELLKEEESSRVVG